MPRPEQNMKGARPPRDAHASLLTGTVSAPWLSAATLGENVCCGCARCACTCEYCCACALLFFFRDTEALKWMLLSAGEGTGGGRADRRGLRRQRGMGETTERL